jgi:hypothetical protein
MRRQCICFWSFGMLATLASEQNTKLTVRQGPSVRFNGFDQEAALTNAGTHSMQNMTDKVRDRCY